jgi:hypothetical protein
VIFFLLIFSALKLKIIWFLNNIFVLNFIDFITVFLLAELWLAGAAVEGVTVWEENNATTCGLLVQSADSDHLGDWTCNLTHEILGT